MRFLIPSLLISIVIINPWFYRVWDELGLYAYWRILWVVPVIPIVAGLIPSITERIQRGWIKAVVAATGVGMAVLCGTFLYNGAGGSFVEAANASKEPDYVVQIADRLLELEDRPRVIAQDPVGVYLRQYTGEIDQLFGRDFHGHILWPSQDAKFIRNAISADAFDEISQYMLDNNYDYIILSGDVDSDTLEYVVTIEDYRIYRAIGHPNRINKRNELGQVISATTVNETGNAVYGEKGYSTVTYKYDDNGFIARELYLDWDDDLQGSVGNRIEGFERAYDSSGNMLMERTLGQDGKPIVFYQNYAEVRYEYQDDKLIKKSYFDENEAPVQQKAGYVSVLQDWSGNNLISKSYLNDKGDLQNRIDGYAVAEWVDGDVTFYDNMGELVDIQGLNLFNEIKTDINGWSNWMTPAPGEKNCTFRIGSISLGKNEDGDKYSCQIEIEFKGVSSIDGQQFLFCTQGSVDEGWDVGNIWSHYVWLNYSPSDGIYKYSTTQTIDSNMANAKVFEIGFRCDNWAGGSFRVRNVKIEKNEEPSEWTPGI